MTTDPATVAQWDQGHAAADAAIDELIAAYRTSSAQAGQITTFAAMLDGLHAAPRLNVECLLIAAVARLAEATSSP